MRQLRKEGVDVSELEDVFEKLRATKITDYNHPWYEIMSEAREALDAVSRK